MARITDATIGHLADLIPSWERSLRAANKAPRTRQGYAEAARRLNAFLEANGMPTQVAKLRREHVEHFIDHLVQTYKPATAANRFRSLQQLFKWLEEEGEVAVSPMARMHPPKVPEVPVPVLGDDELRRLLATCAGKDYVQRRDTAIISTVPRHRHEIGRAGQSYGVRPRPGSRRSHRAGQRPTPTRLSVRAQDGRPPRPVPTGPPKSRVRHRALAVAGQEGTDDLERDRTDAGPARL